RSEPEACGHAPSMAIVLRAARDPGCSLRARGTALRRSRTADRRLAQGKYGMTVARSLWNAVTAFETLLGAYARARAGKRHRNAVASFALRLEEELLDLQRELVERTYRPAPHRVFTIYERKPRLIAAPA